VDFSARTEILRHFAGIGLATCLVLLAGCGYPELSPAAYDLTVTLDNVCSLENEGQLAIVERMIEEEKAKGDLSESDERVLRQIIAVATKGNWEEASRRIRQLRLAQNKPAPRGQPVPRKHEHEH